MFAMGEPLNGIINLNKPIGISSARAVAIVKRLLPRGTKIGHAGTLDPFAAGVLLLLVGRATKSCEALMDQPKQYEATIKFGATTPTEDPESPETIWPDAVVATRESVEAAIPNFVGAIQQRPPVFSAMKVGGRRAYDIARKGGHVALAARTVNVYGIELLDFAWPNARVRIDCSRGTYIRSIARDLGEHLNCGGYLTQLTRTQIGRFNINDATTFERLKQAGVECVLSAVE
jgi:tRNA pseudouridine55 synthase